MADRITALLSVENLVNGANRIARKNPRHRMESKALWHTMAYGCNVLEEFELPNVKVSERDRRASIKKVPENTFRYDTEKCSIPKEDFQYLSLNHASWPTNASLNHKLTALQTKVRNVCLGE